MLTYSTNYFQRLTLESWYTNQKQMPLNKCQPLPALYKRLIHNVNETGKRTSNRLKCEDGRTVYFHNRRAKPAGR